MADRRGDWRELGFSAGAWFGASSHAHAASLAGRIVDVLPDGVPLPDLDVRADGVRVRVGARTGQLTEAISAAARALGLVPDPGVLQEVGYRIDGGAPVAGFWRTALDYGDGGADAIGDRLRRCPVVRFEQSGRAGPLRNRLHIDYGHPGPIGAAVAALPAEGGRVALSSEWY